MAPVEADPLRGTRLRWANRYDASGAGYRITTVHTDYVAHDVVHVKTYRDLLEEYHHHPEAKSQDPHGGGCDGHTVGLLRRGPITVAWITHVGKESNQLEEVEAGLIHDPDEVYTEYPDSAHDPWRTLVLPVLKRMTRKEIVRLTGLCETQVQAVRNGRARPHDRNREALVHAAGQFARRQLQGLGIEPPMGDVYVCAAYMRSVRHES